jgi:predicted neuraminidase
MQQNHLSRSLAEWALILAALAIFAWAGLLPKAAAIPDFLGQQAISSLGNAGNQSAKPIYEERFASSILGDFVHAPSVAALDNGDLLAVWFSGSREGAGDVVIRMARFDHAKNLWEKEKDLITRQMTQNAVNRYIRKLGNPVIAQAPDGKVWIFYVSVSLGGWSKSAINFVTSGDHGNTWSEPQRLITTPFLNVSTLVRSTPIFHANGVIGLPVYHEALGKFPEYLLLSHEGRVLDKIRMGVAGRISLQPAVVPLNEKNAVALLRYAGEPPNHLLGVTTQNRGQSWSAPMRLPPENPNSSAGAVHSGIADWPVLVAQNDLADERFRLTLHLTDSDLKNWRMVYQIDGNPNADGKPVPLEKARNIYREDFLRAADDQQDKKLDTALIKIESEMCGNGTACDFDFEYPTLIAGKNGDFHMVYAWNDTLIKHVRFNRQWLQEALLKSDRRQESR